nr:LPD11 domain-containing protein [Colidextribacter sp. OB.20]
MSISATQNAPVFSAPPLVREPAVPSTEASEPAYLPHELPYIFCEWSESIVFQDKTAYSLQEFDRLMKQADDEYVAGKTAAMAKYGTWQKWYDANDPEYKNFLGYDKVKFTLVMPNGQIFTERQDIGDGDGGVLDFLEQYDKYRKIVPALREAIRKEAEGPLNISTPQPEPVSGRFWDAYNSIKERYHDSLVLYQVGDFFELYGEDAKTAALELDLTLTLRNIPEYGRLPMCGFPAHALEDNAAQLTAQGYDVTVAALEETQRKISLMPAPPVEKAKRIIRHFYTDDFEKPVDFSDLHNVTFSHRTTRDGKHHIVVTADLIDYRLICQADGEVMLSLQCHDMDDLTEYLTNLSVDNLIDYVEAQYKKRQPQQKDDDFSDIDPAAIRAALAENGIVDGHVVDPEKLDANPFIQQVMADVEQIAADALTPDERFSIIETEKGYAVWDDIQGGIYVDGEGVQEEFSSEWQAEDYLKQVRKDAADKEAADWLAVERAKQEPEPQEPAPPASQDRDTEKMAEYLFDQERIVISKFPNGKFYNHYGYDEQRDFSHATAGGFDTFEEAEKALYAHRPKAEKVLEPAEKAGGNTPTEPDYQLLDRLRSDCEYYLGAGQFSEKHLWAGSVEAQISKMRELYAALPEKPEWLTEQDIDRYEARMSRTPAEKENTAGTVEKGTKSLADGHGHDSAGPAQVPPTPRRKPRVSPFVLHPKVPTADRHEYHITDDAIGVGTPGTRFNNNVRAIRLLKKLEREERFATPEEQAVLAQYVGWGGLSDCFDERHSKYAELKALLTEDEYEAAAESTLTAFYTPPVVIRSIYQALENMGFKAGNLLEPSCGIGNFIGMRPDDLADSKIYGIELDSISGRIAQQLYQKSSIAVQGFEKTDLPDSFFDAAIGNVPFGAFKVSDKRYDKHNFLIHDYFFARTLDKVRPGGIIAFVTSKGTMDKENPSVRKYIAQRADLLGAIRLPNNTFKDAAGTEVTSDILFLQKRDALSSEEPAWVHLNTDENGLKMNQYFIDHPDMVMGEMREVSGPHGPETACLPREEQDLGEQLTAAIQNIQGTITEYVLDDPETEDEDRSIPADPNVRNFSYTVVDGEIYYRENSRMNPVEVSVTAANRIKGLIRIRDCVRTLIEYQTEDWPAEDIQAQQRKLNALYDAYVEKYGRINSRANSIAFRMDSAYFLLSSLEVLDDERNFVRKADMFTKRTIRQKTVITSVDTASEALAVSLAEKAKVDMAFMVELTGKTEQEVFTELAGVIFLNPMHGYGGNTQAKYLTADEYLSGNVREKLEWARRSAELYPEDYAANVEALEQVQPVDLNASDISVRLGSTWLPPDVVEQFVFELLDTSDNCQEKIHLHFSQYTGAWNVEGKSVDRVNVKADSTYGTTRVNAYKIIEDTLNLRDVRIFDYVQDRDGKKVAVLNKKETAIAQGKQELIKQAFQDWIWKDPTRRERLTTLYNEKFNNLRPREYDGSHINFAGMNPEITLRPHQLNAIARILYGGNTLLGHVVGAGKTWEMVAAAQESKRLGLCQKSLFVVPNHLTEQWAAEYLQLYPSANILVATRKDFETKNRKRFCSRIATGDYDAVIIGHSQFEKIPMSVERQRLTLERQLDEVIGGISELKAQNGERFSIKQLEKTRKDIKEKLDQLNDQSRKDDVVTFEELGVDRIFIDEAHYYKNLAAFSKMRNVGGISQTEAQKSSDLYMKCRYLDELTDGRGVIFATGTPIDTPYLRLNTELNINPVLVRNVHNINHGDSQNVLFLNGQRIPTSHRVSQRSGVDILVLSGLGAELFFQLGLLRVKNVYPVLDVPEKYAVRICQLVHQLANFIIGPDNLSLDILRFCVWLLLFSFSDYKGFQPFLHGLKDDLLHFIRPGFQPLLYTAVCSVCPMVPKVPPLFGLSSVPAIHE